MTHVNKLYGYFTNGDNTVRKTTTTRAELPAAAQAVIEMLLPPTLSVATIRGLSEFYIRLCFTDKTLAADILDIDPVNSYRLHSFTDNISADCSLNEIVDNIRRSTVPDIENSSLVTDYLLTALRYLIKLLKNG